MRKLARAALSKLMKKRSINRGAEREQKLKELAKHVQYPPRASGIKLYEPETILEAHADILKDTKLELGLVDPSQYGFNPDTLTDRTKVYNYNSLVREVVIKFISYIHLLPASENHHHADVGGLVRHSLEVALYALRHSTKLDPPIERFPDERITKKPRWEYAAWISGLAHDMGKALYDMRVIASGSGEVWNPNHQTIYEWATNLGIERYQVEWRASERHGKHSGLAALVFERILTKESRQFLFDGTDDLQVLMQQALSGIDHGDNNIAQSLKKGEARSVNADMKWQWDRLIGGKKVTIEAAFVKTLRMVRRSWDANVPNKSRIWIIGEDVFLTYPTAISEVLDRMREDGWDVPLQTNVMLDMLAERNLIEPIYDDYLTGYYKGPLHNGRPDRVIKLKWAGLVYEAELTPKGSTGRIEVTRDGKCGALYHEDSTVELFDDTQPENINSELKTQSQPKPAAPENTSAIKEESIDKAPPKTPKKSPTKKVSNKPAKKEASSDVDTPQNTKGSSKGIVFSNMDSTPPEDETAQANGNQVTPQKSQAPASKLKQEEVSRPQPSQSKPLIKEKAECLNQETKPTDKADDHAIEEKNQSLRGRLLIAQSNNPQVKLVAKTPTLTEQIIEKITSGEIEAEHDWIIENESLCVTSDSLKKVLGDDIRKQLDQARSAGDLITNPATPRKLTERMVFGKAKKIGYRFIITEEHAAKLDTEVKQAPPISNTSSSNEASQEKTEPVDQPKKKKAQAPSKPNDDSEAGVFNEWIRSQPNNDFLRRDEQQNIHVKQHKCLEAYKEFRPGAPALEIKKHLSRITQSINSADGETWLELNL